MKHTAIIALVTFAVCTAFGFSISYVRHRSLPEAYQLAVQAVGSRTNELVCIEGKLTYPMEWDFVFEGKNASRVIVCVSDSCTNGWIDVSHK
jgi:hypothetical protein